MKKRQPEAVEQAALFSWALWKEREWPELQLMYHIPNGGSRNALEAAHLKQQGVKAGVPDICLPVARKGFHGFYIEMKAGKNKPTELQKEWLADLEQQGYKTAVCYSYEEAAEEIKKYMSEEGAAK